MFGCTTMFSTIFTRGNNFCDFLFAFLDETALLKWDLLLQKRICSISLILVLISLRRETNENGRVASPESVPIHLNISEIISVYSP